MNIKSPRKKDKAYILYTLILLCNLFSLIIVLSLAVSILHC